MIESKTTIFVDPIPKSRASQNKEAEYQSQKRYECSLQTHRFIISQFTILSRVLAEFVGRVAIPRQRRGRATRHLCLSRSPSDSPTYLVNPKQFMNCPIGCRGSIHGSTSSLRFLLRDSEPSRTVTILSLCFGFAQHPEFVEGSKDRARRVA